jgi:putative transposase
VLRGRKENGRQQAVDSCKPGGSLERSGKPGNTSFQLRPLPAPVRDYVTCCDRCWRRGGPLKSRCQLASALSRSPKTHLRGQYFISYWSHLRGAAPTEKTDLARRTGMLSGPAERMCSPRPAGSRKHVEPNHPERVSMNPPKRKQVRSYNEPGHAHELTFCCFRRLPLFSKDRSRLWFIQAMATARTRCHFALWAYVIMPEHVHIIVSPRQVNYEVRLIRAALKIPVQRKALAFLRREAPAFLNRLRDQQPNGMLHHRFWQRGGGYDRNVTDPKTLAAMIDYLHQNPVRRGLAERATDWVWSSARYYAGFSDVPIEMDPLPVMDG